MFLPLSIGILIGILLSFFAFISGKKFEVYINTNKKPFEKNKMAEIINLKDPVSEFLND